MYLHRGAVIAFRTVTCLSNIVEHGYGGAKRQRSGNDESDDQQNHSQCNMNREMVAVDIEVAIKPGILLN